MDVLSEIKSDMKYNGNAEEQIKSLDELCKKVKNSSTTKSKLDDVNSGQTNNGQVIKTIKSLFSSPIKFHKQIVRGVYLACTIFSNRKLLLSTDEILPVVEVDESLPSTFQADFNWLMKVTCSWKDVKELRHYLGKCSDSPTLHFRNKLLEATMQIQILLGIQNLGRLFYRPIKCNDSTIIICMVKQVDDPRGLSATSTKWVSMDRVERLKTAKPGTPEGMLLSSILEQIHYWHASQISLPKGLYLGYLNLKSTMDSITVVVPSETPNILPNILIRNNPYASSDELEWMKNLSTQSKSCLTTQLQFGTQLQFATTTLLERLKVPDKDAQKLRYYTDIVFLNQNVSFILIVPEIESMCLVTGNEISAQLKFTHLPIQVFEIIHMFSYQPDFICTHCQLSLTLEMDKILAHRALREAFTTAEISLYKERLNQLDEFQVQADNVWKLVRWVPHVLSWAREKQVSIKVFVQDLYNWHLKHEKLKLQKKKHRKPCKQQTETKDLNTVENTKVETEMLNQDNVAKPAVIRVYAAYQTGLTSGTCVKLHISTKTTAREVIDLVVRQLTEASSSKENDLHILTCEQLAQFCLVAVLGARERCLRDDFCPLQLQNPWSKGWLYVRRKRELLAAIQHHNAMVKEYVL